MSERQNIEWKSSWRDEYLKTICAFANADGGQLVIGKDDQGGFVGLSGANTLLETIPSKIRNQLGIVGAVDLVSEPQEHISISIQSYSAPISFRGKYYLRSGSTTHELNGAELTEFLLTKLGRSWDEIEVEAAGIQDISEDSVRQMTQDGQERGRLPQTEDLNILEVLQKLRLANGEKVKRAALVLFGKDPNQFISNCKVMIGRFGVDSEDLKFQEVIEGNLFQMLDKVQDVLNFKFLKRPIDFQGMQRTENEEYPAAAIREILLNAMVHRTYDGASIQIRVYDDRMSVWNEGGLPNGLSIESLRYAHNSKPRNPHIAETCFKAGYIDTWGRGTLKVYKACKEAGLPEPIFEEKDGGIQVAFFNEHPSEKLRRTFGENSKALPDDELEMKRLIQQNYDTFLSQVLLDSHAPSEKLRRTFGENSERFLTSFGKNKALLLFLIAANNKISAQKSSEIIGVSSRTVENYLAEFKGHFLQRIGPEKGGFWKFTIA